MQIIPKLRKELGVQTKTTSPSFPISGIPSQEPPGKEVPWWAGTQGTCRSLKHPANALSISG